MIVRTVDSNLRLITQTDHAHWAYQLLSVWPSLAAHPRRQPILEATRRHDRGWQGIDATPRVTDDGSPHDFRSLPSTEREQIWRRGVDVANYRIAGDEFETHSGLGTAWCELLICHHAWSIHRPGGLLKGSEQRIKALLPLSAVLAGERQARLDSYNELRAGSQEPVDRWPDADQAEAVLDHDYRWVGTLDFLSLLACHGWSEPFQLPAPSPTDPSAVHEAGELRARFSDERLLLTPYPLIGSYSLPLRCREIPLRNYSSDTALSLALAGAPWQSIEIRVARK